MSNYSGNKDRAKNRKENDDYSTPFSMTHQLFENYKGFNFNKTVLEPASGKDAIVKILWKYFNRNKVCYFDIQAEGIDFLKAKLNKYDYIITNPPFQLTIQFIKRAMEIATKKFAFLMKSDFLSGVTRFNEIYSKQSTSKFGLKYFKEFVRKPDLRSLLREDGKYSTGIDAFAWYIWERNYRKQPMISWINNSKYILRTEDLKNDRNIWRTIKSR